MNYTILAPAFYNSWDKVKYLKESADRHDLSVHFYGFGESYKDWHYTQIDRLILELEKIPGGWVIYTDASDAIINNWLPKIPEWDNLEFSVEYDGQLCAGGWWGPRDKALTYLKTLKDLEPCIDCQEDPRNPQVKWRCWYHWRYDFFLDKKREVFQVADEPLDIVDGRIYNPRTQTFPFIVHWAGGYTDPVVGKAALIEPYWRQLGF